MVETNFKLSETNGPINTAKTIVPKPKVPPKIHPTNTTENSIVSLIRLIGLEYFFDIPVIRPSLVPGPRLVIKYMPLPKPTKKVPKNDKK